MAMERNETSPGVATSGSAAGDAVAREAVRTGASGGRPGGAGAAAVAGAADWGDPGYQAFRALHLGFVVAPLLAGLDKFTNLLTDWTQYLWSGIPDVLGVAPGTFMGVVGVVEMVAGVLVAVRPRLGGYVVSAWLVGIILNLALVGGYWDIALRDLGLAIGAFALARLATRYGG